MGFVAGGAGLELGLGLGLKLERCGVEIMSRDDAARGADEMLKKSIRHRSDSP